ncbi:MAG: hypothetical protein K6E73_12685 [Bacteroidales bacterium]|nr:hypothetical protein [Bacteroidales bacterium]
MKSFFQKSCCGCLVGTVGLFVLILASVIASAWLWPEAWGSRDLGNGIYLMDFDPGPIIVKGSTFNGRTCNGGDRIIPRNNGREYKSERLVEFVEDAKSSKRWIIVKTVLVKDRSEILKKFYLMDKNFTKDTPADSIALRHVTCFNDSISFIETCKLKKVDISW